MYLLDRAQFLAMPEDTIFSRFKPELMTQPYNPHEMPPVAFGDLYIKGKTKGNEYEFMDLVESCISREDNTIYIWEWIRAGIAMINRYRRQFDYEAANADLLEDVEPLYAIWNTQDVRNLVTRLNRATTAFPLPSLLLSRADDLTAKWIMVEDAAATS